MVKFLNWILIAIPIALGLVFLLEPSIDYENKEKMKSFYVNISVFSALNFIVIVCWLKFASTFKGNDKKIDDEWVIGAINGFIAYFIFILSVAVISPVFLEFLKSTSAFLASLGVVLAAGVAYWGSSATARREKAKEQEQIYVFYANKLIQSMIFLEISLTHILAFSIQKGITAEKYLKEPKIRKEIISKTKEFIDILSSDNICCYTNSMVILEKARTELMFEYESIVFLHNSININDKRITQMNNHENPIEAKKNIETAEKNNKRNEEVLKSSISNIIDKLINIKGYLYDDEIFKLHIDRANQIKEEIMN